MIRSACLPRPGTWCPRSTQVAALSVDAANIEWRGAPAHWASIFHNKRYSLTIADPGATQKAFQKK
jgi:hypothetical protein